MHLPRTRYRTSAHDQRHPLEADVLIIGGGVAGARAAYDANRAGLSVTMVIKGLLGKSGCSIFAGNLNYFAPPKDEDSALPEAATEEEELRIRRTMAFLANTPITSATRNTCAMRRTGVSASSSTG